MTLGVLTAAAATLAAAVTVGELWVRYERFRGRIGWTRSCFAYVLLNALGAVAVLLVLRLQVETEDVSGARQAGQALTAAAGGLAVTRAVHLAKRIETERDLRSELGQTQPLAATAQQVLAGVVRRADRDMQAKYDSWLTDVARPLTNGWSYAEYGQHLVALCVNTFTALTSEEQEEFRETAARIDAMDAPDGGKRLMVVRQCLRFTDRACVSTALEVLISP